MGSIKSIIGINFGKFPNAYFTLALFHFISSRLDHRYVVNSQSVLENIWIGIRMSRPLLQPKVLS